MLRPEYIEALEARLRWMKWAQSPAGWSMAVKMGAETIFPKYRQCLEESDTFCMIPKFSQLVDMARRDVPDDITFDRTWLQSPRGFLWVPEQFSLPKVNVASFTPAINLPDELLHAHMTVRAVGWLPVEPGSKLWDQFTKKYYETSGLGDTQFMCFQEPDIDDDILMGSKNGRPIYAKRIQAPFICWSYFILKDGDTLGQRIRDFEEKQAEGQYIRELTGDNPIDRSDTRPMAKRVADPLHEIRWIYTALHLMAQRLATEVKHPLDRSTRRRIERDHTNAPPFIRVITLRRLEQARQQDPQGNEVDWQWQWMVRGHWRNQWVPSLGIHRPKFIEAYIKGPEDKPMKPETLKVFGAAR